MKRIHWSAAATRDLASLRAYLEPFDAEEAAMRCIVLATRFLVDNPKAGPETPRQDWRKWKPRGSKYVVIYRIVVDGIEVVRVHHEREDWFATL